jgi:anti-sigma B factor antagonist
MVSAVELNISSRSRDDHAKVIVKGEIDLYTAPRLHSELSGIIGGAAPKSRVTVDMSGVDFCDSTGMNVLLTSLRLANERDVAFELAAPRPAVRKILQVTGLDSVFTISASAESPATPGK